MTDQRKFWYEIAMRVKIGLLIALLAGLAKVAVGQDTERIKYDYIIVTRIAATTLDYSAGTNNEALVDQLKEKKYKNIVDCIRFLEDEGWELMQLGYQVAQYAPAQSATLRKKRI